MMRRYRCIGVLVPDVDHCGIMTVCYLPADDVSENAIQRNVYVHTGAFFKKTNVNDNLVFGGEELPILKEDEEYPYIAFYAKDFMGIPHVVFDTSFFKLYQKIAKLTKKYRFGTETYCWMEDNMFLSCFQEVNQDIIWEFLKKRRFDVQPMESTQKYLYWRKTMIPLYALVRRKYFYFQDIFGGQVLVILNDDMTLHIHSVRLMEGMKSRKNADGDPYLIVNPSSFFGLATNKDPWRKFLMDKYQLQILYV